MPRARQRAVANAVAVHVAVALESAQAIQVVHRQHLAAHDGFCRIGERVRHPIVHAQVEIAHDEDGCLKFLGQVKGLDGHGVALFDRMGEQQNVLGVAVREDRGGEDIGLGSSCGQAGRRAHALDVENHAGHFSIVA